MAYLAQRIQVYRDGSTGIRIWIDGQELPWGTTGGVDVHVEGRGQMPGVTITLAAECVEVVDSLLGLEPASEFEAAPVPEDDLAGG
jgi:hypothetical protein